MIKILFLIHDLGQGGAEKVLVNLVNNMDYDKYEIHVTALFGGGVNEQFLNSKVHYKTIFSKMFPGNSHIMKLLSPSQLHKLFIKEKYDIEISYLEGPSARIISGCTDKNTRLLSWIHCTMNTPSDAANGFRSFTESKKCYDKFDKLVFVSKDVQTSFFNNCLYKESSIVVHNTIESEYIKKLSFETVTEFDNEDEYRFIAVGSLKEVKGFDRLLRITKKLVDEKYSVHLYLLGKGPLKDDYEKYIKDNNLSKYITLLGYKINPYKYISKCHILLCSSYSEGFSTVANEALVLGIPVCTVDVSGMREMLGYNNEYGLVTLNDEESLYNGIKRLLDNPDEYNKYKNMAKLRGKQFETKETVNNVEIILEEMVNGKGE